MNKHVHNHAFNIFPKIGSLLLVLLCSIPAFASDYYWVGGTGNWSNPSAHWATSSGGNVFYASVPSQFDRVIFDANSFSASGQEVTMSAEGFCLEFRSKDVLSGVKFTATKQLNVYNGFSIDSNMVYNQSGNLIVYAGNFSIGKSTSFTLNGTLQMNNGSFLVKRSSTYYQSGGLTISVGDATIESKSTFTHVSADINLNNGAFTVGDTVTWSKNGSIYVSGTSKNLTIGIGNNFTVTSGNVYCNNGDMYIGARTTYAPNCCTTQIQNGHFYIDSTTTINSSANITIGQGDLVIKSGMHWTCGGQLQLSNGSLYVQSGAYFTQYSNTIVYGSLDLDSAAIVSGTTNYYLRGAGNNLYVRSGNRDLRRMQFDGNNGNYTFMDNVTLSNDGIFMYGSGNTINFNGKKINVYRFYHWSGAPITIDLSSNDTVKVKSEFRIYNTATVNGSPVIYYDGTDNFQFISQNTKVWDKVYMKAQNTGGTNIQFYNISSSKSVEIYAYGTQNLSFENGTFQNFSMTYMNNYSATPSITFSGGAHIDTFSVVSNYNSIKNTLTTTGNNFLGIVTIPKLYSWTLGANQTQTLTSIGTVTGACGAEFVLQSNSTGTKGTISMANDTLHANWLKIKDCNATGGAVFIADNTVNLGNVSGWTVNAIPSRDFYWVGNSGNWNDPNHWSLTSGGSPVGCALPSQIDNVFFDSLSFASSGQYVNVNINVDINNFTWGNIVQGASFNGGGEFNIWGNAVLNRKMTYNFGGNLNFVSTGNASFTTDSVRLTSVYFGRSTASNNAVFTLQGHLNNYGYTMGVWYGKLVTNGYSIRTNYMHNWVSQNTAIDWTGTDTVWVQNQFYSYPNCTWTSRPNVLKYEGTNHFYLYGGNHTLNDIWFNCQNTGSSYIEIQQNLTCRDIKVNAPGSQWMTLYHALNARDFTFIYNTNNSANQGIDFQTNNPSTFRNMVILGTSTQRPNVYLRYNNTIDSAYFSNINVMYFENGNTKTINRYFGIQGSCSNRVQFYSNGTSSVIAGTAATLVNVDWVNMSYIRTSGAGSYNATNVLNLGNNSGWNMSTVPVTNFYWVGGAGNWNDPNHWSFTSGGSPGACPIPSQNDNVFFDVNSFSAANQAVNINVAANCNNMSWNNVNYPIINNNQDINIYGSLTLDAKLNWQHGGWVYFRSTNSGNTVTTKGVQMNYVNFIGTGDWTLQDNFKASNHLYVNSGSFISNGKTITLGGNFYCWTGNTTSVNLTGTDTVTVTNEFRIHPNNFTLNMGTCVVKFKGTNNFLLTGGNKTFSDVVFNADNTGNSSIQIDYNNTIRNLKINAAGYQTINLSSASTYNDVTVLYRNTTNNNPAVNVNGNNTFNDVTITSTGTVGPYIYLNGSNTYNNLVMSGVGTRIYMGANQTQTVKDALALGSGSYPVFLQSTSQGTQAILNKASGTVCMDYIWMRDIRATGNASFNAGATSVNLGNNTNWAFSSCAGYYWVGGSGNWSDYTHHWAYSSGGTIMHNTAPTSYDDVFFDANSFTTTGEVVTVDIPQPTMRNLSFASALFTPTFSGSASSVALNVYGSIKLISNMNLNFNGDWNFRSNSDTNDFNTAGKTLYRVNFYGGNNGHGTWTLSNTLTVTDSINLYNGSFKTNGKDVNTRYFYTGTTNTRKLDLSSSIVTVTNGFWNIGDTTNLTFTKGTSEIVLSGTNSSHFYGAGLSYYRVTFRPTTSITSTLMGANTYNRLRFEGGVTASLEPVTHNATTFEFSGSCAKQIVLQSTSVGSQVTLRQTSGTIAGTFINLRDIATTGGATFNANQSQDLGNNSGWNFTTAPSISISTTSGLVNCTANNDGWAKVTVSQGKSPFTYQWSTNETTDSISHLIPGTYTVTVRDSNGCTASDAVNVVNSPSALQAVDWTASAYTICQGTSISFTPNEVSTAMQFDGNDDYIQATHISALNTSSMTVEAWVKADSTQNDFATIIDKSSDTTNGNGWAMQFNGSNGSVRFWTPNATLVSASNLKDKQWHHVAASYDGSTYKLYIDGTLENSISNSNGLVSNSNDVFIGNTAAGNATFSGLLDEIRIWNTARTQTQIQSNRNKDLTGTETNLIAYYGMEYLVHTATLRDLTSNANHATLHNMNTNSAWVNPGAVNSTITYQWNFGDFTSSTSKSPSKTYASAGTYTVSLGTFDKNGCPNYVNKTIRVSRVTFTYTQSNIPCKGVNNGSIVISATGGIEPYTYSINNGSTYVSGSTFSNLSAGTYQVIVRDSLGCTSSVQSVTITQPATILGYTFTRNNPICIGASNGSITLSVSGGTSPYQYSKNSGISYQSSNLLDQLTAGTYVVRVRDANNCLTTDSSITITEIDTTKPVFSSCPSNTTVNAGSNGMAVFTYSTPSATDNCKTPSITRTAGPASGASLPLGTTTFTHIANDSNGNTATCSFTVNVRDVTAPTLITRSISRNLSAAGTLSISVTDIDNGSYDNHRIDSIKVYPSSFTCSNKGNNSVTLWARDSSGNVSTASAIVTVVDATAPNLTCKVDTAVLDINGNVTITASDVIASNTDNCGVSSVTLSKYSFTSANIGSNSVTVTSKDASNNTSTCTTTVVVLEPSPNAICRNKTIYLNASGSASVAATDIDNGSNSSIGISSRVLSKYTFDCSNVGSNADTLTVSNSFNRTAYCIATVTVVDTIKPLVTTRSATLYLDASGHATLAASQVNNGSSDNCSIASRTVYPNTFNASHVGNNTVYLTVTDVNGNLDSASATVTVLDTIHPTVITHAISVYLDTTGNVSITASDVDHASYDNCGIALRSLSKTHFNCSNVGTNVVVLTITDVNGNVSDDTATVTVIAPNGLPSFSFTKKSYHGSDLSCHGTADAEITFNASSGTTPYTFSIDSGSTYQNASVFSGLIAGNYLLKVMDHIGCVSSITTAHIIQVPLLTGTASSNQPICANTRLDVSNVITGGTGTKHFVWSGPESFTSDTSTATSYVVTNNADVNASGTYHLHVFDDNGCTFDTITEVVVNPIPTASIAGTTTVCQNTTSPKIVFKGANGTAPYTFVYTLNSAYDTVTTVSSDSVLVAASTLAYGTLNYSLISVQDNSSSRCMDVASGSASVLVRPMPLFSSDASPVTNTICEGTSTVITCTNAGAGVGSPSTSTLYSNNFNTAIGSGWTFPATNPVTATPTLKSWNGGSVLGNMGAQKAILNLTNIPSHDQITIEYDLYIHDTWDGNNVNSGPDIFNMIVDGDSIMHTTFSNWNFAPYNLQAYPDNIPASHPNFTGAIASNLPTACNSAVSTLSSKYHISKTINHTSSSLSLLLEALGTEVACNESWSIDNLVIQRRTPAPSSNITWSTGETSSHITVAPTDTTTYTAYNGTCYNTVTINVNPTPRANFSIDNAGQCILTNNFNLTNTSTLAGPGGYRSVWTMTGSNIGVDSTTDIANLNYASPGVKNIQLHVTSNIGNCSNSQGIITKQVDITDTVFVRASLANPVCAGTSVVLSATQHGVLSGEGPIVYTNYYTNNFNSAADTSGWSFPATVPATSTPTVRTWSGRTVLGNMGAQSAILNLNNLPAHDKVKVEFDLYIHDSWDGNNINSGPDMFNMKLNGNSIIHTTFSNWWFNPYNEQAYPDNIPATHANFTGAVETGLPTACNSAVSTLSTRYHISKEIAHTANSIQLLLEAVGIEVACNESWSIDSLNIALGASSGIVSNSGVQWSGASNSTNSTIVVAPNVGTTNYVASIGYCQTPYAVEVVNAPSPTFSYANDSCSKTVSFTNTHIESSVDYVWNFGDGSSYTGVTPPAHTFGNGSYTVTLTGTLPSGCTRTYTRTIRIADQPQADFTATSSASCNHGVFFTNTSTIPSGNTASYVWDFGDGSTSTSANPTKAFASDGTFTVTLTVTTGSACISSISHDVTAQAGVAAAVADFTASVVGTCQNKLVTTNLTTGTNNQYRWDLGDGSTTSDVAPVHYYYNGGTKTITLTVINEQGCTSSMSQDITISENSGRTARIGVDFSISPRDTQALGTNKFEFIPNFTNLPLNSPPIYASGAPTWTFGDSTTSTNTHIYAKVYQAVGTYSVKLSQVSTNTGCISEVSKLVTVIPTPVQIGHAASPGVLQSSDIYAARNASGIQKMDNIQFSLYPNPNNGDFKLVLNHIPSHQIHLRIVDMLGREVYAHTYALSTQNGELEIRQLDIQAGSYTVLLESNGETIGHKTFVVSGK